MTNYNIKPTNHIISLLTVSEANWSAMTTAWRRDDQPQKRLLCFLCIDVLKPVVLLLFKQLVILNE